MQGKQYRDVGEMGLERTGDVTQVTLPWFGLEGTVTLSNKKIFEVSENYISDRASASKDIEWDIMYPMSGVSKESEEGRGPRIS